MLGPRVVDSRVPVVIGGCLTQFAVVGLVFSFGLFFDALEDEFGWSRTLLSGSTSLAMLVMGALAYFVGRLSDRYGPTMVLGVAGLMYGLGHGLLANVTEPWHLVLLFGVFMGLGMSTHDVVTLSTIARWFERRRGIMTGVVKVGTATGQMTVPPLTALLMAGLGWRDAALTLGVAATVLLIVAALLMKRPPRDRSPGFARDQRGADFAEVRRSRAFWTLCAAQLLFFPSLITVPLHIAVHGMDLGMTRAVAATLLTAIGGASIVGRLTIGTFADRIGGRMAYILCFVPMITSLCALVFIDAHWLLFVTVALYGYSHGGFFTVVSPTVAELFGMRAHGAIFGGIVFFGTIGGAAGPIMAGRIFDVTGSYAFAFTGLAAMAALGLALVMSLPRGRALKLIRR